MEKKNFFHKIKALFVCFCLDKNIVNFHFEIKTNF